MKQPIIRSLAKSPHQTLITKLKQCTQIDVAREIGYDQSQVSRLVNGRIMPSRDFAAAIAKRFKTTIDDVLGAARELMERKGRGGGGGGGGGPKGETLESPRRGRKS